MTCGNFKMVPGRKRFPQIFEIFTFHPQLFPQANEGLTYCFLDYLYDFSTFPQALLILLSLYIEVF
jgi:hypothetical protein